MSEGSRRETAKEILVVKALQARSIMDSYHWRIAIWTATLFAVVIGLVGCRPESHAAFGSRGTKKLSAKVVLHRTSAKNVVVTDGEDFGIVPGNVQRISITGPAPNSVVVEFIPFDQKSSSPSIEFFLIDLSSGEGV